MSMSAIVRSSSIIDQNPDVDASFLDTPGSQRHYKKVSRFRRGGEEYSSEVLVLPELFYSGFRWV